MCLDPISAASSALSDSSCPQRGKPTPVRSPAPGSAPGPPPRRAGLRRRAAAALPFLEGTIPINFSGRTGPAAQSRTGFPSPYSASRARPALAAAQHSTAQHGAAQRSPSQQPCGWGCRGPGPAPAAAAGPAGTASPRGLRRERCCAVFHCAVPCCASRPWCPAAGTHSSSTALSRRAVAAECTHVPSCSPCKCELTKSHPPKSGSVIYRVCNILVSFPKNTCSKFNPKAYCALPDDP